MQRLHIVGCLALMATSIACSTSDQQKAQAEADRAKQQTDKAVREAGKEAKQLGQQAKVEANKLGDQMGKALNGGSSGANTATDSAGQKIDSAQQKVKNASHTAAVKLDRAALVAKVKAKLVNDVGLSTITSINVDTAGQVVTLEGSVSSEQQKALAKQAVLQVDGVTRVINNLTVNP